MEFTEKVVLITGAAGGIGKETAKLFASHGAKLVLIDLDKKALDSLVEELQLEDYLIQEADVTNEQQVVNFVQNTKAKFGKIDVFFNNAGIEGKDASIIETTAEDLDKVLNVNIKGVFFGLKHVLAVMVGQGYGSVINSASITGLRGSRGLAPYSASKHAVISLSKSAALEVVDAGVRVNAICPGYVDTRMMLAIEEGKASGQAQQLRAKTMENVPMKRYAKPEEIANLVLFLASDASSYITGSQYVIDGGLLA